MSRRRSPRQKRPARGGVRPPACSRCPPGRGPTWSGSNLDGRRCSPSPAKIHAANHRQDDEIGENDSAVDCQAMRSQQEAGAQSHQDDSHDVGDPARHSGVHAMDSSSVRSRRARVHAPCSCHRGRRDASQARRGRPHPSHPTPRRGCHPTAEPAPGVGHPNGEAAFSTPERAIRYGPRAKRAGTLPREPLALAAIRRRFVADLHRCQVAPCQVALWAGTCDPHHPL